MIFYVIYLLLKSAISNLSKICFSGSQVFHLKSSIIQIKKTKINNLLSGPAFPFDKIFNFSLKDKYSD
jgi:hypothetical protein